MSEQPFRIVIVGGGIGGLLCAYALRKPGREIVILEKSRLVREVGAGISFQPNASRIINRWGAAETLNRGGAFPDNGFALYTSEGQLLRKIPFKKADDGAERQVYHRQDLHDNLKYLATSADAAGAQGPPANLRLATSVVACDVEKGVVTLADGTSVIGDLIIGADGIRSIIRDAILDEASIPQPTDISAYRLMFKSSELDNISYASTIMDLQDPYTTIISGHEKRIVMGPVRGGKELALVALLPDKELKESSTDNSWTSEGSVEEMLASFDDFPDWCKAMLRLTPKPGLWQLRDLPPLPRWSRGKAIIVGDAAHAMLPLQGQGASQTVEDAEALQVVLAQIDANTSPEKLAGLLQSVYDGRIERVSLVQAYSRAQAWTKSAKTDAAGEAAKLDPVAFTRYNWDYQGFSDWTSRSSEQKQPIPVENGFKAR